MIDLKVSRELAVALINAFCGAALTADPDELSNRVEDELTQALQNFGQELIREIKGDRE